MNAARQHTDGEAHSGDTTAIVRLTQTGAERTYAEIDRALDDLRNDRRTAAASLLATKAPAPTAPPHHGTRNFWPVWGALLLITFSIPWWVGAYVIAVELWALLP